MRLHFELDSLDTWHRRDIEEQLAASAARATNARLADSAADADVIVSLQALKSTDPLLTLLRAPEPRHLVWSGDDQPAGIEGGLYCSLPRALFDAERHQTFCYPLTYNELVRPYDVSDARVLFSFVGGITSGVRARMAKLRELTSADGEFVVRSGPWSAMLDRSGLSIKAAFAESLRRARFILCPRGNGVGSIRLFEAMEAGRVPVIISDQYVLPRGIDWSACSLRIQEKDIDGTQQELTKHLDRWPEMAKAARQAWEEHFSPSVRIDAIARRVSTLARPAPGRRRGRLVMYVAAGAARRRAGWLWSLLRRRSAGP